MKCNLFRVAIFILFITFTSVTTFGSGKEPGGILTVVQKLSPGHIRNFNPYDKQAGFYNALDWIYEPLAVYNLYHPGEVIPVLATKWQFGNHYKTLTITLRKNVSWSDGETLTANDLIFTLNLLRKNPAMEVTIPIGLKSGMIQSFTQLDSHRVRFTLNKPNSLAFEKLCRLRILPEHIWSRVKNPETFANPNPVGTGAWTRIEGFKETGFSLCRNRNYWDWGKPWIKCLSFPLYETNEQAIQAARLGLIDWMSVAIKAPEYDYVRQSKENRYWLPAHDGVNLQVNTTKKPFHDLRFRRAISLALNRKDMIEIATYGLTIASEYPIGLPASLREWFDHRRLKKYRYLMEYNPTTAMEILEKAGYRDLDGDGFRENPDGSHLFFRMEVPSTWTDWVNTLQVAGENLRAVGIHAVIATFDEETWDRRMKEGKSDVVINWVQRGITPWNAYEALFNPNNMGPPGEIDPMAVHRLRLPAIEKLLDQFVNTGNRDERFKIMGRVQELVAHHLPIIHLFSNPGWYQYNTSRFKGFVTKENPFITPFISAGDGARLIHAKNISLK